MRSTRMLPQVTSLLSYGVAGPMTDGLVGQDALQRCRFGR